MELGNLSGGLPRGPLASIKIAGLATALTLLWASAAHAVEPAASAHLGVSKVAFTDTGHGPNSVNAQIQASRADMSRNRAQRNAFITAAAKRGLYYDQASVDVLHFDRTDLASPTAGWIEAVVPREYQVHSVELGEGKVDDHGKIRNAVSMAMTGEVGSEGSELAFPDGPGFTGLTRVSSGYHYLYTAVGQMDAYWDKKYLVGDLNSSYDWWGYDREAHVRPADISGPDYFADNYGMRSYPHANASYILAWDKLDPYPPKSIDGNCSDILPLSIDIGGSGVSFNVSFKTCETYEYSKGNPGDESLNWENAWILPTQGGVDGAFLFSVRTKPTPNATPKLTWYDYQYVNFYSNFYEGGLGCGSTDSGSVTC